MSGSSDSVPCSVLSAGSAELRFYNEEFTPHLHPFPPWHDTDLGSFLEHQYFFFKKSDKYDKFKSPCGFYTMLLLKLRGEYVDYDDVMVRFACVTRCGEEFFVFQ